MNRVKEVGLFFIIIATFPNLFFQQSLAKEDKTGIQISAICDKSKLNGTKNSIYILKPDEYHQYLDKELSIEDMKIFGNAPLLISSLQKGFVDVFCTSKI